jgi:hypothetical protein
MLADPCRPTAIFCVNDLTALGILRGLCRRGLSVPEDIALVGYDDVEFVGLLASSAGWRLASSPLDRRPTGRGVDAHHLTAHPPIVTSK